MVSHVVLMVLFAGFVSLVFALLMRDDPREQVRLAALLWAAFTVIGVLLGWLMYPPPL